MKTKLLPFALVTLLVLNPVPAWQPTAHAQWADEEPPQRVDVIGERCRPQNGCYLLEVNNHNDSGGWSFWDWLMSFFNGGDKVPDAKAIEEVVKGWTPPCAASGESEGPYIARATASCYDTVKSAFPGAPHTSVLGGCQAHTPRMQEAYLNIGVCK